MSDTNVAQALEALQAQVADLSARLGELEARNRKFHPEGDVPEEVVLAVSAAVAAFLGKRAVVKVVHRRRGATWTAAGRRNIHSSHNILTH